MVKPLGMGPTDSTSDVALAVGLILTVPIIVLAIGCANTANLQLARAAHRQTEMAVRLSLGATRARVVRQLLVESLIVAALAGIAGGGGHGGSRRGLRRLHAGARSGRLAGPGVRARRHDP